MNEETKIEGNKNNVKTQHIVPNFLLKNFSKNDKIFQFDIKKIQKKECFFQEKNTKKSAIGRNYYNTESIDGKKISSEDTLGEIENNAAPIIKEIVEKENLSFLSESQKKILLKFVIIMFLRSPLVKKSSNYKSKGLDQFNKLSRGDEYIDKYKRGCFYLKEYKEDLFISDTPVVINRKGRNISESEWFLPISNNLLLISCSGESTFDINNFNLTTEDLNMMQIIQAAEFIYTKNKNKDLLISLYENSQDSRNFLKIMNTSIDSQKREEDPIFITLLWEFIIKNKMNKESILYYLDFHKSYSLKKREKSPYR